MNKDPIHYLAVEVLDVAVRAHFTAGGIEEVETLLRAFLRTKMVELVDPVTNGGFISTATSTIQMEEVPKPVRVKKPKAS